MHEIRAVQLRALEQAAEPHVFELTRKLIPSVDALDVRAYLPLVDMTLPALRALSPSQYQEFTKCFVALVQADQRLGLFEWTLHQILLRHLRPQFERVRPPQILYYGLQRLAEPCSVLLSTLARASQSDDQAAFDSGARQLPDVAVQLLPPELCELNTLQQALGTTLPGRRQTSAAAGRRLRRHDLRRRASERRRGRTAAGRVRHARLPDAAALAWAACLFAVRSSQQHVTCEQAPTPSSCRPRLCPRSSSAPPCCASCVSFSATAASSRSKRRSCRPKSSPSCTSSRSALENGDFLQASPELHMKRLLAAGAEAIFQVTRSFRGGERGQLHNPEFTLVEWYRVGDDMAAGIDLLDELAQTLLGTPPAARTSYAEAFQRTVGLCPHTATPDQLAAAAAKHDVAPPATFDRTNRDEWLNLLLALRIEPLLGHDRPEIVYHYPATQAALAKTTLSSAGYKVAERFELYYRGIELANGYHELADAVELRRRLRSGQRGSRLRRPPCPAAARKSAGRDETRPARLDGRRAGLRSARDAGGRCRFDRGSNDFPIQPWYDSVGCL